jgi:hypothetical protein
MGDGEMTGNSEPLDSSEGPIVGYGRCPHCGASCRVRERRLGGNDTCYNGHVYPSSAAISQASPVRKWPVE